MYAELTFERGLLKGKVFVIRPDQSFTVGRLPTSAIVIDHPMISRSHATLELRTEGLYVTDMGSNNGTEVNGQVLTPGRATPVPNYARVRFAGQELAVRLFQHDSGARRSADLYRSLDAPMLPEGKYKLLSHIGNGASGRVWSALRKEDSLQVAIKVLASKSFDENKGLERFQREAQLCCSVSHPNIVQIYEFVLSPEQAYIVMELVHGPSMRDVLHKQAHFPISTALRFAGQIAGALATLEEANIVHRDVKPGNILLDPRAGAKLVDFGIAKELGAPMLTGPGVGLGSLNFVSPEQALEARSVDHRADIYGLGASLYSMIAGRPPLSLKAKNSREFRTAIERLSNERPKPLSLYRGDCTKELSELVESMIEKVPEDRPSTAREVKQQLDTIRKESYAAKPPENDPRDETGQYPRVEDA